jgi:hypothetical protein
MTRLNTCAPLLAPDTVCSQKPSQKSCQTSPSCTWHVFGQCNGDEPICATVGSNSTCSLLPGCNWSTVGQCYPKCSQYKSINTCNASVDCQWISCAQTYCSELSQPVIGICGQTLNACNTATFAPGCNLEAQQCVKSAWRPDALPPYLPTIDYCATQPCLQSLARCNSDAACSSALYEAIQALGVGNPCDSSCQSYLLANSLSKSSLSLLTDAQSCYFNCPSLCTFVNACPQLYSQCLAEPYCAKISQCFLLCVSDGVLLVVLYTSFYYHLLPMMVS